MVMPSLLLQKRHAKAGSKDFSQHLSHCLTLWKAGNIKELHEEANAIQARRPEQDKQRRMTTDKLNRRFAALISKGGVLELTYEVQEALRAKQPEALPASTEALIQGETLIINSIFFENLTGEVIHKTALTNKGAAGPFMGDAYIWRHMLVSFKSASEELCNAVAEVARHLATNHVNPKGLCLS